MKSLQLRDKFTGLGNKPEETIFKGSVKTFNGNMPWRIDSVLHRNHGIIFLELTVHCLFDKDKDEIKYFECLFTIHHSTGDYVSNLVTNQGKSNMVSVCKFQKDKNKEREFTYVTYSSVLSGREDFEVVADISFTDLNQQALKSSDAFNLQLITLFDSSEGSDINVITTDGSFAAHKLILSMRSAVFKAMFNSQMSESVKNEIEITDFEPTVVRQFIRLLYSNDVINDIKTAPQSSEQMFKIAHKYQVLHLQPVFEIQMT